MYFVEQILFLLWPTKQYSCVCLCCSVNEIFMVAENTLYWMDSIEPARSNITVIWVIRSWFCRELFSLSFWSNFGLKMILFCFNIMRNPLKNMFNKYTPNFVTWLTISTKCIIAQKRKVINGGISLFFWKNSRKCQGIVGEFFSCLITLLRLKLFYYRNYDAFWEYIMKCFVIHEANTILGKQYLLLKANKSISKNTKDHFIQYFSTHIFFWRNKLVRKI